jgi:type I restriction enzyme, S subunit
MNRFETVKLGECADVISGYAFKSSSFTSEGIPVIKISNIRIGSVDLGGIQFVDKGFFDLLSPKYRVCGGDILISLTGSQITQPNSVVGRIARQSQHAPICLLNQRAGKIIISDSSRCDEGFLYWVLFAPDTRGEIAAMAHGAANQANVSPAQIKSLELNLPELPVQRRIASILSAYDDLIENNTRRIQILEEMAQRIYKEWFVDFRFPGHEKAKFVDSELGRIPSGWEVKKLEDLTRVVTKGTTPTTLGKTFQNEGINFFKVESIDESGGVIAEKLAKIDYDTHLLLKRSQIQLGDILFSIAGAIGRSTLVTERFLPANTNQALAIIRPSDRTFTGYLYQLIRAQTFLTFSLGRVVQTAQANVSLGVLKSAPILLPEDKVLRAYNEVMIPTLEMVEYLRHKNQNLRQTRDLLLPKLISGEIDVSEMPEPKEASAA